jgi:hypothetical protein
MLSKHIFWQNRLKASGIHLAISLGLAMLAAALVFLVWYPYPYSEISGGRSLFLLVVCVDVMMGPLLTLVVFNRSKPDKELRRDLIIIGLLQLAALTYGLWTAAVARPVHLVFEMDRFRVVHATEVPPELLGRTPAGIEPLPFAGPTLLSVRKFHDSKESFDATMAALQGVPLSARPDLWQPYANEKSQVIAVAKPIEDLKKRFPRKAPDIDAALKKALSANRAISDLGYVPMIGRQTFWTVFIDLRTADVVAFLPVDSF